MKVVDVDPIEEQSSIIVRLMQNDDWANVQLIYEKGLGTRNATFETRVPTWKGWNASHLEHSRLVALEREHVVGWAALTPYSRRSVYQGVAELSIYVDPEYSGRGIGSRLMDVMDQSARSNGCWMLQSSIFPENLASIALHKKFGFREVGYRERIAQLDGYGEMLSFLRKDINIKGGIGWY